MRLCLCCSNIWYCVGVRQQHCMVHSASFVTGSKTVPGSQMEVVSHQVRYFSDWEMSVCNFIS